VWQSVEAPFRYAPDFGDNPGVAESLIDRFRSAGRIDRLFPEEIEILEKLTAEGMSAEAQLAFLRTNRAVSAKVLLWLGSIRLLALAGGGIAAAWFGAERLTAAFSWLGAGLAILGALLLASAISLALSLSKRRRAYRIPLTLPDA
jgi:hypothetical protein